MPATDGAIGSLKVRLRVCTTPFFAVGTKAVIVGEVVSGGGAGVVSPRRNRWTANRPPTVDVVPETITRP